MDENELFPLHSIKIAETWAEYGRKEEYPKPEFVFQFMSKWVAINYLYTKYKTEYIKPNNGSNKGPSERWLIKKMVDSNWYWMRKVDFKQIENIQVLFSLPVYEGTHIPNLDDYDKWKKGELGESFEHISELKVYEKLINDDNSKEQLKALFLTIYQIRCNLFHASKLPMDDFERNKTLIEIANSVLDLYLDDLIQREKNN